MSYHPPRFVSREHGISCRVQEGSVYEKTLAFACGGLDNLLAFVGGGYGD